MRKLLLFSLIVSFSNIFGEQSYIGGFLNDNYTGSVENGINGNYIGADDFLTFSLFAKSKNGDLALSQYYNVVTSRKYGYRYDLLDTNISLDYRLDGFILTPNLSLLFKSNFGGEIVQNSIHAAKDLPRLKEEYSDSDFGLVFGLNTTYDFDFIRLGVDLEFPTTIKPIFSGVYAEYLDSFGCLNIDFLVGYKQYITEVSGYSELVRSGVVFGGQGILTLYKNFTINAGALFFPAKNLENDPIYSNIDHSYSPQFWVTLGVHGESFNILDIVNF